jgi:hypothetical protein
MKKIIHLEKDSEAEYDQPIFDFENNENYLYDLISQCGDCFLVGMPSIRPYFNQSPNTGTVVVFSIPPEITNDITYVAASAFGQVMEVRIGHRKLLSAYNQEDDGNGGGGGNASHSSRNHPPQFIEFYDLRAAEQCVRQGVLMISNMEFRPQLSNPGGRRKELKEDFVKLEMDYQNLNPIYSNTGIFSHDPFLFPIKARLFLFSIPKIRKKI